MQVKDGICGLTVGDALGVPVEFCSREELERKPLLKMQGYRTYNMPPGTFSDDTSMTLATMNSIVKNNGVNYNSIMEEFVKWFKEAKYTQYNSMFDIGGTTRDSLNSYESGSDPLSCGKNGFRDNGNGSLMRILPIAYITNDYKIIENVSSLTHSHDISKIACCLYCEIANQLLNNKKLTIKKAVRIASEKIIQYYHGNEHLNVYNRIFNESIYIADLESVKSSGYVVDTLESVIYVLGNTESFEDALLKAVNLGSDTDTIGAICGGIAGIYYGFDEIPSEWLNTIKGIDKILELCEKYEECL